MKKEEILKIVEYKGDNKEIKQKVIRIHDLLTAIPEDADLGAIPGIDDFKENGAFGAYNNRDSRINSEEEKNRILSNLDSIFHEITKWIKDHSLEVKYNILTSGRKNDKKRRIIFISILALIAAAAITFTLLQRMAHFIPDGVPIGEIIGLVDFVLGIFGFIYELLDDGKEKTTCGAVDDIKNSQTADELLTSANKFVKVITKIDNSHHNVRSLFGGKIVDNSTNYTQRRDDRNE